MTSSKSESTSSSGRPAGTEFKWICPYCGESRVNQHTWENGEADAVMALRSHIGGAAGDGHGPQNEIPEDKERPLFEYVRHVDGSP